MGIHAENTSLQFKNIENNRRFTERKISCHSIEPLLTTEDARLVQVAIKWRGITKENRHAKSENSERCQGGS